MRSISLSKAATQIRATQYIAMDIKMTNMVACQIRE